MSDDFIEYHKINSLFKRDEKNRFVIGDWATEELAFLQNAQWDWTEKVDGTNIRIKLWIDTTGCNDAEFRGRTDNAQFSKPLYNAIDGIASDVDFRKKAFEVFSRGEPVEKGIEVLLFGEGYGAGVQKGGMYRPDPSFILFDVLIDNQWWMPRGTVVEMGTSLGLDTVPFVGTFDIHGAIKMVQSPDFKSVWPDAHPEGLVGVPSVPLFDRRHRRIVTKVKVRDFAANL